MSYSPLSFRRGRGRGWGLFFLLLALTGCGDDPSSPGDYPTARMASGRVSHPVTLALPKAPKPRPAAAEDDPLASPDTLANGPDRQDADTISAAPPLTAAPDADRLSDAQPRMPTRHSHWLKGSVLDAAVVVTLNQAPLVTLHGPVDRDITMRCRPGANTITFAYAPGSKTAFADLRVLESEHDPPIAPLAAFRTLPLTVATMGDQKRIFRAVTFVAR